MSESITQPSEPALPVQPFVPGRRPKKVPRPPGPVRRGLMRTPEWAIALALCAGALAIAIPADAPMPLVWAGDLMLLAGLLLPGAIHRGRWLHVLAMLGCIPVFIVVFYMARNALHQGEWLGGSASFLADLLPGVLPWGWLIDAALPLLVILAGELLLRKAWRWRPLVCGVFAVAGAAALSLVVHDVLYRAGWLLVPEPGYPLSRYRWVGPAYGALRAAAFWALLAAGMRVAESRRGRPLAILAAGAAGAVGAFALWFAFKPIAPPGGATVSAETTGIVEPLRPDGAPDYAEYVRRRLGEGVTAENNAAVPLLQALGPGAYERPAPVRAELLRRLGIEALPPPETFFAFPKRLPQSERPAGGIGSPVPFTTWIYLDRREGQARFCQPCDELLEAGWKASEHPEAAACVQREAASLDLLVQASGRPRFFFPVMLRERPEHFWMFDPPGLERCAEAAELLTIRAMLHCGEGRHEQAWGDILALFRLSRLLASSWNTTHWYDALTIDQYATLAARHVILDPQTSRAVLGRIIRDLQALAAFADPTAGIECALLLGTDGIVYLAGGGRADVLGRGLRADQLDWDEMLRGVAFWRGRDMQAVQAAARQVADPGAQVPALPKVGDWELARRYNGWTLPLLTLRTVVGGPRERRLAMTQLNMSDVLGLASMTDGGRPEARVYDGPQPQARIGLLAVAAALGAYSADTGAYPDSLEALTPEYLPHLPPAGPPGCRLVYTRAGPGWRLESAGWLQHGYSADVLPMNALLHHD